MEITTFFEELVRSFGYIGVAVGLYIEHVFPPAPTQIVIPISALLVVRHKLDFFGVWASSTVGATLGSWTLYEFGRWANEPLVRRFIQRYGKYLTITEADLERSLEKLDKYGGSMVFFSHMIPLSVIRVIVSIFAGVQGMTRFQFVLYSGVGSILWIGGQLYVIVLLGDNWRKIADWLQPYEPLVWGAGVVCGVLLVLWYIQRLRRQQVASE